MAAEMRPAPKERAFTATRAAGGPGPRSSDTRFRHG
eukprot:CAMPEP_0117683348 /NCGR_PEP_ID=MMETSP0804-20121206/20336_1 /TAXON_ID=1074897 /ORGANISM="Tetraselmis astigmatica, Strain CCMP880" /LENGTH=35 /DNA_ID= /DNA_START= /DNA_END= /DNA_ORIENTATION=